MRGDEKFIGISFSWMLWTNEERLKVGLSASSLWDCWNSRCILFTRWSIYRSWTLRESSIKSVDWVFNLNKIRLWRSSALNSTIREPSAPIGSSANRG